MAYAKPNKTQRGPVPAPRRGRVARVGAQPTNPLADFAEAAGTTNFGLRVALAWDPPSSTSPNWVDVTPWVEQEIPIGISHGRADGLADANATTITVTVDNSDGRFCAGNTSGPWYGLIHKGVWLKVEILPPSGVISRRFTGFVTSLPTAWQGQYAISRITASDRFEKLGQAPALISSIQSEVLTDPNLAAGNPTNSAVKAYWNLHEGSGALTFGDTSGNSASHLVATGFGGVPAGIGMGASNTAGPGFDGTRTVTFNPPSASQGTYLSGTIAAPPGSWNYGTGVYTGLYPTVEFWVQATTTGVRQTLLSLIDPVSQSAATVFIHPSGQLEYVTTGTTIGAVSTSGELGVLGGATIADGNWHHVVFAPVFSTNAGLYYSTTTSFSDGGGAYLNVLTGGFNGVAAPTVIQSNYTQITIGGGYDFTGAVVFAVGAANISDVAFYWADMKNGGKIPNVVDHYAAGRTGNAGETTDSRVARVARYAGVPIPLQTTSPPIFQNGIHNFTTQTYSPVKGPWTNLSAGAHACGTQSVSGRKALDVMREAARTEGTPLFVDRSGYLALQASTIRQNTSPAWTVDARDLAPDTAMPDDFAYTVNQMTVTPNSQAAQTVIGTVGQASQNKYGVYDKSQATASLNPVEARSLGSSFIQLGADPAPRLAPLSVEVATLATQTGYGAAWYDAVLATEVSTPIRVTNLPAQAGGGSYDVLIEGWTETITAGNHLFSFTTSPVQGPTYQLDDVVLGRADTDASTLTAGITSAATSMTVATTGQATGSPLWVTDGLQFPFDVKVDTEQITVTSISTQFGTADGTFESGVGGWSVNQCTLAAVSSPVYAGTKAALMTVVGTPAQAIISSDYLPVAGNTQYVQSAQIAQSSGSPQAQLTMSWYDSGHVFISTTNGAAYSPSGAFSSPSVSVISPVNAAYLVVQVRIVSSPATGTAIVVDNVVAQPTAGPQVFQTTRSVNGVVASHSAGAAVSLWSPTTLAY